MQVGIPRETLPGETRVAATPETVKKLAQAGHQVRVERGAGTAARYLDADYEKAGAELTDADAALGSELVLKVRRPDAAELSRMKPGAALLGMLDPFDADGLKALAGASLTAFALEAAPRTTRAQSLDVLSSQANLAGYKAVLLATQYYGRIFPMMMTAAGTLKAARVVVLGAGVAGLQAIATARRLGAVVEASVDFTYDWPGLSALANRLADQGADVDPELIKTGLTLYAALGIDMADLELERVVRVTTAFCGLGIAALTAARMDMKREWRGHIVASAMDALGHASKSARKGR